MTGAIASLHDFSGWASGNLLVIVLLVLGAILLTRLANWVRGLVIAQIEAREHESDELVRSEAAKHRQVIAQVVTWAVLAVMYVVTAVLVVKLPGRAPGRPGGTGRPAQRRTRLWPAAICPRYRGRVVHHR